MSTPIDYELLDHLFSTKVVTGSALEVGSRVWPDSSNAEELCRRYGMEWTGADIEPGEGVDIILDILDPALLATVGRRWDSVLVMNLLEHVYDPITALRNCCSLVESGGTCVVIGPVSWQLHDYPHDYWRPLPDFYLEFAKREGMETDVDSMWYLTLDRLIPVRELTFDGQKYLPSKAHASQIFGRTRSAVSKVVHRGFNTYGRDCFFPGIGLGAVLRKP